jgi:carboxyl-terminal processing protease
MMNFRRQIAAFCAIFFLVPTLAFARSASQLVDITQATVTRADFMSWTLEVLNFEKSDSTCTLPYARVPRGIKATLCTVQEHDALSVFGSSKTYPLAKPLTRGEALMLLTKLLDESQTADVSAFSDVKTANEKAAVMNAVALSWMRPLRANLFGLNRPITPADVISLLNAVSSSTSSTPTIHIELKGAKTGSLPQQELMQAVWDLLQKDYLRQDKVNQDELAYKTIESMVNSLGDPYTTFFRPAGADDFESQIKGEISGIGAQIEDKAGVITVVTPLPGSPAEKAGLMVGDEIIEADGHPLSGIGSDKAVSFIRGERGTTVMLKIRRNGAEMNLSIMRDTISIPEIDVKWQGDIAIVQLMQFGQKTDSEIRSIFSDIVSKHPHGIVLDLRNNGGGLLDAADKVMSNFVPNGTVVAKVQSRNKTTDETTSNDPIVDTSTKVVVLVNKGSASASEIVAGALQDLKRATIVGTQTFGKGTVQEVIGFRGGEALKLTIAEWLTPLGRHLDGVGVKPDIIVDSTDRNAQLQRALEILR